MVSAEDLFDLARFIEAQNPIIDGAMDELRAGRKRSHWMWFVFPQLRGLGSSPTAYKFGISSIDEASAYQAHPVLGKRLVECTRAVLDIEDRSLNVIFGSPDDLKFCSSMTLFARASGDSDAVFQAAIDRFCGGRLDQRALGLLDRQSS